MSLARIIKKVKVIFMLHIYYGRPEDLEEKYPNLITNSDAYFKHTFRPHWLENDLAKRIVRDVDKSEVLAPYCIQSPVLGQISPDALSSGVKALILMMQDDEDVTVWATVCGDNCAKWILEIAKQKELHIVLSHLMRFGAPSDEMIAVIENVGKTTKTVGDYIMISAVECDVR